jgi:hypothetical protein
MCLQLLVLELQHLVPEADPTTTYCGLFAQDNRCLTSVGSARLETRPLPTAGRRSRSDVWPARLFNVAQYAVQLFQTIVGKHQFSPALAGVLDQYRSAEAL